MKAELKKIQASDFLDSVATFNADPYCVEYDELCDELYNETEGVLEEITDEDEFEIASEQLNLTNANPRHIYRCGRATVCLSGDFDDPS